MSGLIGICLLWVSAGLPAGAAPAPAPAAEELFGPVDKIQGQALDPKSAPATKAAEAYRKALEALLRGDAANLALLSADPLADLGSKAVLREAERSAAWQAFLAGRDFSRCKTFEDAVDCAQLRVFTAGDLAELKSPALKDLYRPAEGDLLVAAPGKAAGLPKAVVLVFNKDGRMAACCGLLAAAAARGQPAATGSKGRGGGLGMGKVPVGTSYYIHYVPRKYNPEAPCPLVVHLHGAGSSPDDSGRIAGEVRKWTAAAEQHGFVWIGVKSVGNAGWGGQDAENITAALKDAEGKWNIQLKSVYLSGFSAGAFMCSYYGTGPKGAEFAALCAFCIPYTARCYQGQSPRKMPAYFTSNSGDFNFKPTQTAAADYQQRGHLAKFVDETGRVAGHRFDAKTALDAYEWMRQHQLP